MKPATYINSLQVRCDQSALTTLKLVSESLTNLNKTLSAHGVVVRVEGVITDPSEDFHQLDIRVHLDS